MKNKIKSLVLTFVMLVAAFSFAACKKDKDKDVEKDTPTVNAYVIEREYYENEKLSDIEILISEGDTEGTISWKNKDKVLVLGENKCEWKFSPKDDGKYETKTGHITIVAKKEKDVPTVNPAVSNLKVYAENKLSSVTLSQAQSNTPGTFSWVNENMELKVGENECIWKFVPTDSVNFRELTGKIIVTAVAQQIEKIEVKTNPTKTSYKAFETFAEAGLSLKATFDGGKVETISEGWTVSYVSGTNLKAGDSKVVVSYASKTCDVAVSVSKIEIAKPQVNGTYVYNGKNQTAVLKTNSNSTLYTVSNNVYQNAGTHDVTVTLKDFANYKWVGAATKTTTIQFVIEKAEQSISKNAYTGIFDNEAHTSSVTSNVSTEIYYSTTKLTSSNYNSVGSKTKIEFVNAGSHKVYFYIVGNTNYKDTSGEIVSTISKAVSRVVASNTVSFVGEFASKLDENDIVIYGLNDMPLDKTDAIEIVYYTEYTDTQNNVKTNADNGASTNGAAPNKAGDYVAIVTFKGDTNHLNSSTTVNLKVYSEESGVYATSGQDAFAWRSYVTFASTKITEFITGYFEVKKQYNGYIYYLVASLKLAEYDEGVVVTEETYDGEVSYVGSELVFNATGFVGVVTTNEDTLTIERNGEDDIVLNKWDIPKYIGRFEKDNVGDGTTANSYIEISVEYGEVTFVFNYRYKKANGDLVEGTKTGSVNFAEKSGTLNFVIAGEQYFSMKLSDVENVNTISIANNFYNIIVHIRGDYARS